MLLLRLSHSATLFPYTTLFRSEFLKKAIERKYLVFGTTVVLLILSVYRTKFINTELAPETEADEISINFYMADGMNIAVANTYLPELLSKLAATVPADQIRYLTTPVRTSRHERHLTRT